MAKYIPKLRQSRQDKKRRSSPRGGGRRPQKFILPSSGVITYKDFQLLQKVVTDRGKILSRRLTGVTAKEQRMICTAVKRAKLLALLPTGSSKRA